VLDCVEELLAVKCLGKEFQRATFIALTVIGI
jgi:hypothetical protein